MEVSCTLVKLLPVCGDSKLVGCCQESLIKHGRRVSTCTKTKPDGHFSWHACWPVNAPAVFQGTEMSLTCFSAQFSAFSFTLSPAHSRTAETNVKVNIWRCHRKREEKIWNKSRKWKYGKTWLSVLKSSGEVTFTRRRIAHSPADINTFLRPKTAPSSPQQEAAGTLKQICNHASIWARFLKMFVARGGSFFISLW